MANQTIAEISGQEWEDLLNEKNDKLKQVLQKLRDVRHALDQSAIVAITDHRGTILYANSQFCRISGYEQSELIGQDHRLLNSGVHPKAFFKNMWACIGSGNIWRGEICNRAKDGSLYWVDTTIVPFLDQQGKIYQYISIRYDITSRKQMEESIKKSEERYRFIAENTTDIISMIDPEGNFQYLSPSHKQIFVQETAACSLHNLLDWVHEADRDVMESAIRYTCSTRKEYLVECRLQSGKTATIWTETKMNPILDEQDNVKTLLLVTRDITERKHSEERIHHLAYHDPLTDLPNRRMYIQHLNREIRQAKRFRSQLAVFFLDLDRFKDINDSYGHETGDMLLVEAARRLSGNVKPGDLVARLGGDEFTMLLHDVADTRQAAAVAERIIQQMQQPFFIQGKELILSCSIGISLYPKDGDLAEDLLKRADTALYTVKSRGRNGYDFFDPKMEAKSLERILMENEMRKALEQKHFEIYYQPKTDIASGRVFGMEALVRWIHPELGVIPPNRFIPIAEETGMILELGEWILREACSQNKAWYDQGHRLKVSVNLSARQIYERNLVEKIRQILDETQLPPDLLELEITESIFLKIEEATAVLEQIREAGIQISIDDFGAGYSSFSYLKNLPVDTIKIDASFIRDIHHNLESQAIVKAIVTIAESLNLNVIAEGVELTDQAEALKRKGCGYGQGYLYAKPLPKADFDRYLQQTS